MDISIIILLLIIGIIAKYADNYKPSCYKKDDLKRDRSNPGCTGDTCAFKYDCKYYKNYMNDC